MPILKWCFPDCTLERIYLVVQETQEVGAGSIPRPEGPLEEEMATHSKILGRKIPWTEEHGGLYSSLGCKVSDVNEWRKLLAEPGQWYQPEIRAWTRMRQGRPSSVQNYGGTHSQSLAEVPLHPSCLSSHHSPRPARDHYNLLRSSSFIVGSGYLASPASGPKTVSWDFLNPSPGS